MRSVFKFFKGIFPDQSRSEESLNSDTTAINHYGTMRVYNDKETQLAVRNAIIILYEEYKKLLESKMPTEVHPEENPYTFIKIDSLPDPESCSQQAQYYFRQFSTYFDQKIIPPGKIVLSYAVQVGQSFSLCWWFIGEEGGVKIILLALPFMKNYESFVNDIAFSAALFFTMGSLYQSILKTKKYVSAFCENEHIIQNVIQFFKNIIKEIKNIPEHTFRENIFWARNLLPLLLTGPSFIQSYAGSQIVFERIFKNNYSGFFKLFSVYIASSSVIRYLAFNWNLVGRFLYTFQHLEKNEHYLLYRQHHKLKFFLLTALNIQINFIFALFSGMAIFFVNQKNRSDEKNSMEDFSFYKILYFVTVTLLRTDYNYILYGLNYLIHLLTDIKTDPVLLPVSTLPSQSSDVLQQPNGLASIPSSESLVSKLKHTIQNIWSNYIHHILISGGLGGGAILGIKGMEYTKQKLAHQYTSLDGVLNSTSFNVIFGIYIAALSIWSLVQNYALWGAKEPSDEKKTENHSNNSEILFSPNSVTTNRTDQQSTQSAHVVRQSYSEKVPI